MATVDRVRDDPLSTTFAVRDPPRGVGDSLRAALEGLRVVHDVRTAGPNDLAALVRDDEQQRVTVTVDVEDAAAVLDSDDAPEADAGDAGDAVAVVVETIALDADDAPDAAPSRAASVHETVADEVGRYLASDGSESVPSRLAAVEFLQRQSTRTRLATDRSVDDARRAVRTALDRCEDVAAWNDDGVDVYAESDEHRGNDGYRSNVDVYAHDDGRTHVLVDSASKWFFGTYGGSSHYRGPLAARADAFHDHVVRAIVAELADTPPEHVSPSAWAPAPDANPLAAIRDDFDDDELVHPHSGESPATDHGDANHHDDASDVAPTSNRDDPGETQQTATTAESGARYEKRVADRTDVETNSPSGPNPRLLAAVVALAVVLALTAIGSMDVPPERKTQLAAVAVLGLVVAGLAVRKLT